MRNLLKWALCATVMWPLGCNQERNKSIELMNHGVEMGRQKLFDRAVSDLNQALPTSTWGSSSRTRKSGATPPGPLPMR